MTGTRCREKQDATHTPTGLEHVGGGVNEIKTDFQLSTLKERKNTLFWGGNTVKNVPSSHPDRLESREETRAATMQRQGWILCRQVLNSTLIC